MSDSETPKALELYRGMEVATREDYLGAAEALVGIERMRKQIRLDHDQAIKDSYELHKRLTTQRRMAEAPYLSVSEGLRERISEYLSQSEPGLMLDPLVPGIMVRDQWSAEVTDMVALLKGVLEGVVPYGAVAPVSKVLNEGAKSLQEMLRWPGVKAVCRPIIAVAKKDT